MFLIIVFYSFFFRYLFSFRDCTVPLRGCVNHIREPVWC
nr:MAG TPA: hypothetical protein [Caudoviricetes sp.]